MLTIRDKHGNTVIDAYDGRYAKRVLYVATHLRAEDFDECFAIHGESPHLSILKGWAMSSYRGIISDKIDRAVGIFGVRPAEPLSRIGVIWLLGTDGLNNIKKFFLSISKPIIGEMSKGYDVLINYVDARYIKTLRWLRWCGFTVDDPEPFGALDLPFHRCYMETR
jgi:hypothetical protein